LVYRKNFHFPLLGSKKESDLHLWPFEWRAKSWRRKKAKHWICQNSNIGFVRNMAFNSLPASSSFTGERFTSHSEWGKAFSSQDVAIQSSSFSVCVGQIGNQWTEKREFLEKVKMKVWI